MSPSRTVRPVVLKLGGEVIEDTARRHAVAKAIVKMSRAVPLVVVHGGGREIDTALKTAGIEKRQIDGLRVTDEATLDVVVAVLAGRVNTRLVAAVNGAGGQGVGLTAVDAKVGLVKRAPRHKTTTGDRVDLGFVGHPLAESSADLVLTLVRAGFVPVIASIGASQRGTLFNVNADTLAGNLAVRLKAARLIIAGGTPGVLDGEGRTVPILDGAAIDAAVAAGTVNAGMVAKLVACREALAGGVRDVRVADGLQPARLATLVGGAPGRAGSTAIVK